MAINQNHLFEELNGVKCAIVEKNVPPARVEFLRGILEYNGYTVIVVPSPPPKGAPAAGAGGGTGAGGVASAGAGGAASAASVAGPGPDAGSAGMGATPPPAPETFTVGVTDVMFNPVNAIFGRLLKTPGGHAVTLAYWRQQEKESHDEIPYFDER
jgi:hypothetical protein